MDERIVFFRVGVVVLATAIIAGIMVLMFNPVSWLWGSGQYPVVIELPRAPGVMAGTPIQISGKTVGRVDGVTFTDERTVRVAARIDDNIKLYPDDRIVVRASLLGDSNMEIVGSGDPKKDAEHVEPGHEFQGSVDTDPLETVTHLAKTVTGLEDDIRKSVLSMGKAGDDISKLATRLDDMLEGASGEDNRFDKMLTKTETALDNFNETMTSLQEILGDKQLQADLKKGLADMPKMLEEMNATMSEFRIAIKKADTNLENLKDFTGPLGEKGPEMVADLRDSVGKVDELLSHMVEFSESINSQKGTLGQLVHNPELYQNLNRAARNIQQVSVKMKPVVDDLRIFSDKIARDPGRLGVRGAMRRESGVK